MNLIIKLIPIIVLLGCSNDKKFENDYFTLPVIHQDSTEDSIYWRQEEYISHAWARVMYKNTFVDTLFVPVQGVIDTNFYKSIIRRSNSWELDSLGLDGFEVYPDYSSTIARVHRGFGRGEYYYPVHIVNQTPLTKVFKGKDSYVFAIQEAQNEYGFWFPIEGKGFDFCGNGYWDVKVESKEFITVLFPKYNGEFKTKLRVRIRNGNTIYVSQPYDGVINKQQFILEKDRGYHYDYLIENRADAVQNMFYGAKPLELWDENFGKNVDVN